MLNEPTVRFSTEKVEIMQLREEAPGVMLRNSENVEKHFSFLKTRAQETCYAATLDKKQYLVGTRLITIGIADACLLHPREVFRRAILDNASYIVLCHNHPSGDPSPSAEDIRITRQLVEAGHIIGITVCDHVIIGRDRSMSMREQGLVNFGETE